MAPVDQVLIQAATMPRQLTAASAAYFVVPVTDPGKNWLRYRLAARGGCMYVVFKLCLDLRSETCWPINKSHCR